MSWKDILKSSDWSIDNIRRKRKERLAREKEEEEGRQKEWDDSDLVDKECKRCGEKKKIDKDDFLNCLGCGYVWDQK